MRIVQQHRGPLAPGIKRLYINTEDRDNLSDAFLAVNPSLEVVELQDPTLGSREFLYSFLHALKQGAPKLRRLLLEGKNIINLYPILWFDKVEELHVKLENCYLSPRFIDQLGDLAHLRTLVLHVGAPSPDEVPLLIRSVGDGGQVTNHMSTHRFDQIRSLHIISELLWVNRIMEHMNLQNVQRFVFQEIPDDTETQTESIWTQCFRNLAASPTVEEIEIRQCDAGDPGHSFSVPWLSPLFRHRHLKCLVITGAAFSASDFDILRLLSAFPSLKKLILPPSADRTWPTMKSIFQLCLSCLELEEVEIFIGGTFRETLKIMQEEINRIPRRHDHPLRFLRISSGFGELQHEEILECARFLYRAFSNLVTIKGFGPKALEESWSTVHIAYNLLQTELRIFRGQ